MPAPALNCAWIFNPVQQAQEMRSVLH